MLSRVLSKRANGLSEGCTVADSASSLALRAQNDWVTDSQMLYGERMATDPTGSRAIPAAPRPTAVSIIGWIWVGLGVCMSVSAMMAILVASLNASHGPVPPPPITFGRALAFVFDHFTAFAVGQLIFAAFIIYSALRFLRLRWWAWRSLQVITWLALLYVVVFGIFWVITWIQFLPDAAQVGEAPVTLLRILGAVMGTVVTLTFSVPLVVMLPAAATVTSPAWPPTAPVMPTCSEKVLSPL